MDINVTVSEVTLDSIVRQGYDGEAGATIADLVAAQVVQRLASNNQEWYELHRTVTEIKREVIREAVLPMITQAISEPIQKTSAYGDPIGEPTTLRSVIVDEAQKMLNRRADTYGSNQTVLQKIVAEEVQAAFKAEIKDAVAKARASVADEIGKQVASAVAAAMKGR